MNQCRKCNASGCKDATMVYGTSAPRRRLSHSTLKGPSRRPGARAVRVTLVLPRGPDAFGPRYFQNVRHDCHGRLRGFCRPGRSGYAVRASTDPIFLFIDIRYEWVWKGSFLWGVDPLLDPGGSFFTFAMCSRSAEQEPVARSMPVFETGTLSSKLQRQRGKGRKQGRKGRTR